MAKKKRNPQDLTLRNVRASNRRTTDLHKKFEDLVTRMNEMHQLLLELQSEMQKLKPARERRKV